MFLLMPREKKVTKGNKKDGKAEIASSVISPGDKLAALISVLTEAPSAGRPAGAISHSSTEGLEDGNCKAYGARVERSRFSRGADTGISCKSSPFPRKSPQLCTSCQDAGVSVSAGAASRAVSAVWTRGLITDIIIFCLFQAVRSSRGIEGALMM